MSRRAVIVGAGLGGLSAAVALASAGWSVLVLERGKAPGGKAGTATVDGVVFDTGPSVLTLPDALDAVLRRAGSRLEDHVRLRTHDPSFRYLWPDGARVDVHPTEEATLESVAGSLGPEAAGELRRFLAYAAGVWAAAAPRFVLGPAPGLGSLMSPAAILAVTRIDGLRTMRAAIHAQVRSPHLRDLLARYATYNGSDPRRTPATLNCIAHVELGLGGFGVEGGIGALVEAFVAVALAAGVTLRLDATVDALEIERGRVNAVRIGTERVPADVVIANAEFAHVLNDLLPPGTPHGVPADGEPSTSGWNGLTAAPDDPSRAAHTVLFPPRYEQEFVDLFDRRRPPDEPTVYLCDQSRAHGRAGWPDGRVPLFAMTNAPAGWNGPSGPLRERAEERMRAHGFTAPTWVWERAPRDLAARFPGSGGALYGLASNSVLAAFRRPANRARGVRGLYFASGSAHPGGGLPLCARSGLAAADAVLEDAR